MILNRILVLIETYWNVNQRITCDGIKDRFVLIETYWNVNLFVRCD